MLKTRFGWLLAAVLLASGCGSKATQVIVTIDAEDGVRADSARLHVVVPSASVRPCVRRSISDRSK